MRFQQICFSVQIPELLGPMFCMRLSESGSFVLPAQASCLQIEGSFPTFHTQGPTVTLHCGRIPMISNSYMWLVLAIRGSFTWLVYRTLAAPAAHVLLNFSCVIDPKSCNLLVFSLAKGVKRVFFAQGPGLYKDPGPARAHKEAHQGIVAVSLPALPRSASQWGSHLSNGTHPRTPEPCHQSFTDPS